jgi:hypothetical protein
MKPTNEEIEKEIETLKRVKLKYSPKEEINISGVYPDSIHLLIDDIINVLEKRMSSDDISDKFTFAFDDNCGEFVSYGEYEVMDNAADWMKELASSTPSEKLEEDIKYDIERRKNEKLNERVL